MVKLKLGITGSCSGEDRVQFGRRRDNTSCRGKLGRMGRGVDADRQERKASDTLQDSRVDCGTMRSDSMMRQSRNVEVY